MSRKLLFTIIIAFRCMCPQHRWGWKWSCDIYAAMIYTFSLCFFGSPQYIAADALWYNVHGKVMYVSPLRQEPPVPWRWHTHRPVIYTKGNKIVPHHKCHTVCQKDQDLRMPLSLPSCTDAFM